MSVEFKWNVSFTLHNIVIEEPISFDGMEIIPHPKSDEKSPKALVNYRFATPSASPNIFPDAKDRIEKFLDIASMEIALTGWDVREMAEDADIELENRMDLMRQGISPPAKLTVTMHSTSVWTKDFAYSCWDWSKKLTGHKDAEALCRILRLLRQSTLEEDEYDRFSKIWRSFNAFYNHLAGDLHKSETHRIKNFATCLNASDSESLSKVIQAYWTQFPKPTPVHDRLTWVLVNRDYVSLMDCLIKQNFTKKGINHSQKLALAVSARDVSSALQSALLWLCKVLVWSLGLSKTVWSLEFP